MSGPRGQTESHKIISPIVVASLWAEIITGDEQGEKSEQTKYYTCQSDYSRILVALSALLCEGSLCERHSY